MGFFSYTCAKTNIPFAAGPSVHGDDASLSRVVILFDDEPSFEGDYDGFGRVRELGVHDLAAGKMRSRLANGTAKVVLAAFHDPKADTVDNLGKNRIDKAQGLHAVEFLKACHAAGGFASHDGYLLALEGFASPGLASGMGREKARAVIASATALCEAVSGIRMSELASRGVAFAGAGRIYPHHLGLRPEAGSVDLWAASPEFARAALFGREIDAVFSDACRGVTLPVGEKVAGRRDVTAAAKRLSEALRAEASARVPLLRDGDEVGEALAMRCPMGATWYEAHVEGEPGQAFLNPSDMARALELEDAGPLKDGLFGRVKGGQRSSVDLPPRATFAP